MLVILEGADGSGKTSLANRIRKDLDQYLILLRSNGAPKNLADLVSVISMLDSLPSTLPIITDRNPVISEYIYGPILRGECIHKLGIDHMKKWFKKAMIIHCRPNYEALAAGVRRETQLEGVLDNHRHIIKAYDQLMGQLEKEGVYVKRYDYTGPPQQIMDAVKYFIQSGENK